MLSIPLTRKAPGVKSSSESPLDPPVVEVRADDDLPNTEEEVRDLVLLLRPLLSSECDDVGSDLLEFCCLLLLVPSEDELLLLDCLCPESWLLASDEVMIDLLDEIL